MSEQHDGSGGVFPPTQWSLVERAGGEGTGTGTEQSDGQAHALGALLHRYVPALRAYLVSAKRIPVHDVDDLVQGFVTEKVLEQRLAGQADRTRGRFRSLLIVALDRYLISQHRQTTAGKRLPAGGFVALDEATCGVTSPSSTDDALSHFNAAWARAMVAEALAHMRSECDRSGRADLWRIFKGRVVGPAMEGLEPADYDALVAELGLKSPLQACFLLTTAKRMFTRNLRAVAAQHVGDDPEAVDEEIADLRRFVGASCA
jgi:RNA polymerase sigma-70 factor (ECF subfamily)